MSEATDLRTVLLVRHAKSDWPEGVDDADRPLTEKGKKDAALIAERVHTRIPQMDLLISSPARRTRKTAKAFARAYQKNKEDIVLKPELYLPYPEVFFEVLSDLDSSIRSVSIFSHNNGITDFANMLGVVRIDELPTCGVLAFGFTGEWNDIRRLPKNFLFFDRP